MLVELVASTWPLEDSPHEARRSRREIEIADEMQHAPAGHEVRCVGVVFDVADCFTGSGGLVCGAGIRNLRVDLGSRSCRRDGMWVRERGMLGQEVEMGVIEMVRCVAKCIYFQFCEEVLRNFLKQPVNYHSALDGPLAVEYEDYFREVWFVYCFFDNGVAVSNIGGGIVEVALD